MRKRTLTLMTMAAACFLAVCALAVGPVQGQIWYKPGFPGQQPLYPNYLGAPSGMPDFDQQQNFDGNNDATINPAEGLGGIDMNYCAPTAAANCLWWFGSVTANAPTTYAGNSYGTRYPPLADVNLDGLIDRRANQAPIPDPDDAMALVQNLANLMDTNDQRIVAAPPNPDGSPAAGTWVPANVAGWWGGTNDGFGPIGGYGLEPGIREYIDIRNGGPLMPGMPGNWNYPLSVPLEVRSICLPNFGHFRTELLSCNNIILTVADPSTGGHIEEPRPVPGDQTGFHCVTAAGVTPPGLVPWTAISDPWTDQAELGFPGRVLPAAHPGAPHAANVHNDPQMVSQDAYQVNIIPHPTMGWAGATTFQLANYMNIDDNDATVAWMTIVYATADMPVSFSVAPRAQGIVPAQSPTNDVYTLNSGGFTNEGEILGSTTRRDELPPGAPAGFVGYAPGMTAGNNQAVIDGAEGAATLGLVPGDNVDSLSYGKDAGDIVYFSVDPNAIGMPTTAVFNESRRSNPNFGLNIVPVNPQNPGGGGPGAEAAGDIFKAKPDPGKSFGRYYNAMHFEQDNLSVDPCWICDKGNNNHPANKIFIDDAQVGLQAPGADAPVSVPAVPEDDLDAFEYASATDPVWGVDTMDSVGMPGPDGTPDEPVFFTLAAGNPSGQNSCDILVFDPSLAALMVYADGINDIGLDIQDDIDALALADVEVDYTGANPTLLSAWPDAILDPDFDEALFSLAPGSPSLGAAFSPGDIFYTDFDGTFSLWTGANQIGLMFVDNLNALDVKPCVPEPCTLLVVLLGLAGIGPFRTRRRRI